MIYKNYTAKMDYDEDTKTLYGRVLGIRDVVDFQASSPSAVEKEFRASVDEYLAFCKKRGEQPDKPYSGKWVFRTTPEIHRKLAMAAERAGKSLNQFLEDAASNAIQP